MKVLSLPTGVPPTMEDYHHDSWEPVWAAAEEAGMVVGFHIGTDSEDPAVFGGPGGAILNYVETTYGGQRAATKMVASGALDRHPNLKVLISEGGATWVPFLGDRMNEGYRQHGIFVRPKAVEGSPRSTCTGRSTPRSSMMSLPRRAWRWATATSCGAVTTRTSRARSATRRRRFTSCSTGWTRRSAPHHPRRLRGVVPARSSPPA